MSITIGIDIGGSATKIAGIRSLNISGTNGPDHPGTIISTLPEMLMIQASGPVASMHEAIGKFLSANGLERRDISAVYLTGVGSSFIDGRADGMQTIKVPEFDAIGRGGLKLSGLTDALVVSMGTGTSFVRASGGKNTHIGGTGIGGGTILGLASQMPCAGSIEEIIALAQNGNIRNVDLFVGDIAKTGIDTLPLDLTASNFGKLRSRASDQDTAIGLINMVFETIGMMALMALKNDTLTDVVLTGTLATFPQAKTVFDRFTKFSGKNFVIPSDAAFATVLGMLL